MAVIGKDWLKITGDDGRRRIDDPNDYVHIEIATALNRRIPVIPVLVENTSLPRSADLPEPLRDLAFRNSTPVRSDPDFHHDIDRLCSQLAEYLPKGRTKRPAWAQGTKYGKFGWAFGGVVVLVILLVFVISSFRPTVVPPRPTADTAASESITTAIDTSWHKTGPISGFSATDYPSGLRVKGHWKTFGGPDDLSRGPDEGLSLVIHGDIKNCE